MTTAYVSKAKRFGDMLSMQSQLDSFKRLLGAVVAKYGGQVTLTREDLVRILESEEGALTITELPEGGIELKWEG